MILLHIILLKAYRKATYAIHLYYYEVKKPQQQYIKSVGVILKQYSLADK